MEDVTTHNTSADTSMELLGDLEERLQALKQWQKESAAHASEIEQRERDASAERAALNEEAQRLAADRKAAAEERVELEQRKAGLESERSGLAADEAVLEAEKQRIESEAARIESERNQLDRERSELSERSVEAGELEARAAQLNREAEELSGRVSALDDRTADLETRESAFAGRSEELDRRSDELDAFREELDTELQRLSDLEAELNTRASGLDEREARLSGDAQRETDEQLAALTSTLEEREVELARSRRQLDEAGAEVLQLKEALQTGGTEAAPPPAADAPGVDVEAMQAELDKRAHNLKRAKRKILDLQDEVRKAADASGESAIFSATDLESADGTELKKKLEAREQELNFARKELELGSIETAKLRTRVDELIKRAERSKDASDHDERAAELDERADRVAADRERILERKAQLKAADALIKSRREKLRKYVSEFRANRGVSTASAAPSAAAIDRSQAEALENERTTLLEVKRFLQASETVMVKRWALQKATGLAATLVIAVAAASAVSWTAAGVIAKPLYQATLTLQILTNPNEEPLPPGVWLSGYGRDLLSDSVLGEIQNQLGQRDLRLAGTVEGLRDRLADKVEVSGDREALEVTFTDPDPALVTPVLDAIGRGLLINQMAKDRRAGRMSDTASLTSEAVRRERPVKDERFHFFGIILACFAGLALLAAIPARLLAGRARPVLPEGAVPELATLDHPSPLVADAMKAARVAETDDEDEVMRPIFRF